MARLARLELRSGTSDGGGGEPIASVAVPGGAVQILASEAFDAAELEHRRTERRRTLEAEIGRAELKLANRGFVEKAPPAVVEGEREKLARFVAELAQL